MADLITIGIFYDGGYIRHVNEYYLQHGSFRNRIDLGALHEFIRHEVSKREGVGVENTKIFDKCFFSGRFYTSALLEKAKTDTKDKEDIDERYLNLLKRDRFQEDELMSHGIKTFYRPMRETEKGIDSLFSLETYIMSASNKYRYVVLLSGDGDHVTLVTKLRPLGCKTLLLGWDFSYYNPEKREKEETYTSGYLREAVTYSLDMTKIIETGLQENDPLIMSMFKQYEKKILPVVPPVVAEIAPTEPGPAYKFGTVQLISPNHGLIKVREEPDAYFFSTKDIEILTYDELCVGDEVKFLVGKKAEGKTVAKNVRRIAKAQVKVTN